MTSACASLSPLDVFKEKPTIDTNVQIAENANNEENIAKLETVGNQQAADLITNDTTYVTDTVTQVTQQLPTNVIGLILALVAVIIFLAGWSIPTPGETARATSNGTIAIYKGIRFVIADILNSFILTPIKGIANFILKLFGREPL